MPVDVHGPEVAGSASHALSVVNLKANGEKEQEGTSSHIAERVSRAWPRPQRRDASCFRPLARRSGEGVLIMKHDKAFFGPADWIDC